MIRTLAHCLVVALSVNSAQFCLAQSGQVSVVVPATPGQPGVEGTRPEPPAGRRGGKPRFVLALPKEFEARDKNGDGQIGLYEWERSKYAEFVKLDKNGDGFLTAQELTAKGSALSGKLRIGGGSEKEALPNPGNLVSFNQKIGETITVSVTGQTKGSIWGSGPYTTDSDLATVAVHAGILKDGETGMVRVTITESPNEFAASTANSVSSNNWPQAYPAAYTVR